MRPIEASDIPFVAYLKQFTSFIGGFGNFENGRAHIFDISREENISSNMLSMTHKK